MHSTTTPKRKPGSFFLIDSGVLPVLNTLPSTSIRVYLALSMRADSRTRECWPSIETIAHDVGASTRSAERAIIDLRNAKLVAIVPGRGCKETNRYRLVAVAGDSDHGPVGVIPTNLSGFEDSNTDNPVSKHRQPCRSNTDNPVVGIPTNLSVGLPKKHDAKPPKKQSNLPQIAPVIAGGTRRRELEPRTRPKNNRTAAASHEREFEEFWRHYPRQVGKQAAARAFAKAATTTDTRIIVEAARAFATSDAGQAGRYTPHPATWLNAGRYLDDQNTWSLAEATKPTPRPSPLQLIREAIPS